MKLKNEKLLELLDHLNGDRSMPENISTLQFWNFEKCFKGENTKPAYMNVFCKMAKSYDFSTKRTREALNELSVDEKPLTGGEMSVKTPDSLAGKRFVFTSAQNNTETHEKFLHSILNYCEHNNAQLLIGQFVYNKSGFQNGVTDDNEVYYSKDLQPFFETGQLRITKDLVWCGDLNILPTAKNPITGFETLTGTSSCIIPHAKIALESMATPKSEICKMIYATGCITMRNYIQKKAGQIAQHAHCYGALVVDISESGEWFARQIQTDESGIFQDLRTVYTPDGVKSGSISGINWGDIHAEKSDEDVLLACETMLDYLKPTFQVFHDTFDMTARNHHNRKSGHFLAKMFYENADSVKNDIVKAASVLARFNRDYSASYIIESNHDLALESWLNCNDYDFKRDPINAVTYLELQTHIYSTLMDTGNMPNILEFSLTEYLGNSLENFTFLNVDDSLVLQGVECGMHGHIGANGSRGTPMQFQKLNRPINTGHTHTASIKGSVYTAGVTGSLDMGYNQGASSWSHSHILTYPNGFRAIITMKGGLWDFM